MKYTAHQLINSKKVIDAALQELTTLSTAAKLEQLQAIATLPRIAGLKGNDPKNRLIYDFRYFDALCDSIKFEITDFPTELQALIALLQQQLPCFTLTEDIKLQTQIVGSSIHSCVLKTNNTNDLDLRITVPSVYSSGINKEHALCEPPKDLINQINKQLEAVTEFFGIAPEIIQPQEAIKTHTTWRYKSTKLNLNLDVTVTTQIAALVSSTNHSIELESLRLKFSDPGCAQLYFQKIIFIATLPLILKERNINALAYIFKHYLSMTSPEYGFKISNIDAEQLIKTLFHNIDGILKKILDLVNERYKEKFTAYPDPFKQALTRIDDVKTYQAEVNAAAAAALSETSINAVRLKRSQLRFAHKQLLYSKIYGETKLAELYNEEKSNLISQAKTILEKNILALQSDGCEALQDDISVVCAALKHYNTEQELISQLEQRSELINTHLDRLYNEQYEQEKQRNIDVKIDEIKKNARTNEKHATKIWRGLLHLNAQQNDSIYSQHLQKKLVEIKEWAEKQMPRSGLINEILGENDIDLDNISVSSGSASTGQSSATSSSLSKTEIVTPRKQKQASDTAAGSLASSATSSAASSPEQQQTTLFLYSNIAPSEYTTSAIASELARKNAIKDKIIANINQQIQASKEQEKNHTTPMYGYEYVKSTTTNLTLLGLFATGIYTSYWDIRYSAFTFMVLLAALNKNQIINSGSEQTSAARRLIIDKHLNFLDKHIITANGVLKIDPNKDIVKELFTAENFKTAVVELLNDYFYQLFELEHHFNFIGKPGITEEYFIADSKNTSTYYYGLHQLFLVARKYPASKRNSFAYLFIANCLSDANPQISLSTEEFLYLIGNKCMAKVKNEIPSQIDEHIYKLEKLLAIDQVSSFILAAKKDPTGSIAKNESQRAAQFMALFVKVIIEPDFAAKAQESHDEIAITSDINGLYAFMRPGVLYNDDVKNMFNSCFENIQNNAAMLELLKNPNLTTKITLVGLQNLFSSKFNAEEKAAKDAINNLCTIEILPFENTISVNVRHICFALGNLLAYKLANPGQVGTIFDLNENKFFGIQQRILNPGPEIIEDLELITCAEDIKSFLHDHPMYYRLRAKISVLGSMASKYGDQEITNAAARQVVGYVRIVLNSKNTAAIDKCCGEMVVPTFKGKSRLQPIFTRVEGFLQQDVNFNDVLKHVFFDMATCSICFEHQAVVVTNAAGKKNNKKKK